MYAGFFFTQRIGGDGNILPEDVVKADTLTTIKMQSYTRIAKA